MFSGRDVLRGMLDDDNVARKQLFRSQFLHGDEVTFGLQETAEGIFGQMMREGLSDLRWRAGLQTAVYN